MDNKVRISELPEAESLTGLYTIGTDADNNSVKVALGDELAGKQGKLSPGENITITDDNVISAAGADAEPITDGEIDELLSHFSFLDPLDITAEGEEPLSLSAGRDGGTFRVSGSVDIAAISGEEIAGLFD